MSASRIVIFSAKFVTIAGANLIGMVAPTISATHSVADTGGTSQTPALPDGSPWMTETLKIPIVAFRFDE